MAQLQQLLTSYWEKVVIKPDNSSPQSESPMSIYESLFKSDKDEAVKFYNKQQEKFDKSNKGTLYFAFIAGPIFLLIINSYFGETISSIVGIVGILWYYLGYMYCQTLWEKEKDMREFYATYEKFEKNHSNKKT